MRKSLSSCSQQTKSCSNEGETGKDVGGGLFLVPTLNDENPNSEILETSGDKKKRIFKFYMEIRNMLLKVCLDKEVWNFNSHGDKIKTWKDVVTILQSIPNYQEKVCWVDLATCKR